MTDHKQISKLLEHWGMENETVTSVYHAGTSDRYQSVFSIGKGHILKCTTDIQTIYREKEFLDKLRKAGAFCARIVPTRDGCDFVEDGEDRYYLVTRIDGDTLCSQTLIESREDALYLGEMIAQLHGVLSQMDVQCETVDLLQTLENWAIPRAKAVLLEKQAELDAFMNKFALLYPHLPQQLIHRDVNPSNIVRSENGWSFIDFELSQKTIRIYDPCYAATAVLSERFNQDREKWFSTYHAILDGYDIVGKFTDAENEALPYVTIANQLVCIAWFSQEDRYREILRINREMTIWLIDHFEKLKRK